MKQSLFLATPGPVNIPDSVFNAMRNKFYHRNQDFADICIECSKILPLFFNCPNETVMIACSGTGAMETSLINILSPNDKIICIECGKFSERFAEIARAFNCRIISIKSEYGTTPDPDLLKKALTENPDVKAVTTCYCETSTCVLTPIQEYAKIVASTDALFIVDGISAVGAMEIDQEKLKIDLCIAAGHKGFMTPPVISFLSYYGDKIFKAFENSTLPKFYFNVKEEIKTQKKGLSLWTPAMNNIIALKESLSLMMSEGIENIYQRHKKLSEYTLNRAEELGLDSIVKEGFVSSPSVSGFYVKNANKTINKMKDRNILIAGGQGLHLANIIRIGHLGNMSLQEISWVMDNLAECI